MKFYITLIVLCLSAFSYGQCPSPGSYALDSQQKIDDFPILYPNCTQLYMGVAGTDIVNLNGLTNITTINGLFVSNTSLTNFNGLENVTTMNDGDITIEDNDLLTNMDALNNMTGTACALYFFIENNPLLESLQPLGGLEISNFAGCFDTISWGGINNNDSLINLEGLGNFSVPNYFTVSGNASLESFQGFDTSFKIGGAGEPGQTNSGVFKVSNNSSLVTIDNLSNVTVVNAGWIEITNNASLETLVLGGVVIGTNHRLDLYNNPNLEVCSGDLICDLLNISTFQPPKAYLDIRNNGAETNSPIPIAANCNLEVSGIKGRVKVRPNEESTCDTPLPNVTVVVQRGGSKRRSITNANGEYGFIVGNLNNFIVYPEVIPNPGFDYVVTPEEYIVSFSPPGQVKSRYFCVKNILGIDDYKLNELIKMFPNPVAEILNIELDDSLILLNANVKSVLGEVMMSSSRNIIDVSNLSSGIYFIEIVTDKGTLVRKIVKE